MGTIPLPALDTKAPTPINPLDEFARVSALKSQMQAQQLQSQEIQIRGQQVKDQQATTAAMQNWNPSSGDYDSLAQDVLKNGGSATAATAIQQHGLQVKQNAATLTKAQQDNYLQAHKIIGDRLQSLLEVPDADLPGAANQTVNDLVNQKFFNPQEATQLQQKIQSTSDPTQLRQLIDQSRKMMQGASAVMGQKKEQAQTEEAAAKGRESNAAAALKEIEAKGLQGLTPQIISDQVDKVFDPRSPQTGGQNRLVKAQATSALQRGDLQGAKLALQEGFQSALGTQKDIAVATNPAVQASKLALVKAEKAAEQAIADGDPKAAAQLLVSGTVAPSQLISSRKPAFAQQAFSEAAKLQPGWTATRADAEYKVASSPANVGFFGSAKSLTDKGGTLDQLAAAAKDIPDNQIPVFNTVEDAIKASTGSGPIAKYASIALGVADDYSKVMGGGQGSDASRTQALHLVGAKLSPEQRKASIEGIRGAVSSQTNSRIGKNPVLQQMYGDSASAPAESSAKPKSAGFSWEDMPEHK